MSTNFWARSMRAPCAYRFRILLDNVELDSVVPSGTTTNNYVQVGPGASSSGFIVSGDNHILQIEGSCTSMPGYPQFVFDDVAVVAIAGPNRRPLCSA